MIARKMQESKRRIPHFTYVEEIDVTEVESLRARLNEKFAATRGKLTLHQETVVPATLDETFAFFSDAANLERLTPPWPPSRPVSNQILVLM